MYVAQLLRWHALKQQLQPRSLQVDLTSTIIFVFLNFCFVDLEYYRIYDASYATGGSPDFCLDNEDIGPVLSTNMLLQNVNSLSAHGGGDCPEYGMTGILKAIELINAIGKQEDLTCHSVKNRGNHHLILLTDAPAKDDYLYSQVISDAKAEADVTIHMFFSGAGCSGSYDNYVTVADETGGVIINAIDSSSFETFAETIWSRLGTKRGKETGEALCHDFDIGVFVIEFSVLFKTYQPTVTITRPDGSTQVVNVVSGNFATHEETNPQYGTYQACVATGTLTLSVAIKEGIDMTIDYVERSSTGEVLPTTVLPVSCKSTFFCLILYF